MFATHYHELTQLEDDLAALRNYNVAVREVGDQILFVHRLQRGGADRSYGIEVGRLAGLPAAVLDRARDVLAVLEGEHLAESAREPAKRSASSKGMVTVTDQLGLFGGQRSPVVEKLRAVDVNAMTPLDALTLLARLADEAKRDA